MLSIHLVITLVISFTIWKLYLTKKIDAYLSSVIDNCIEIAILAFFIVKLIGYYPFFNSEEILMLSFFSLILLGEEILDLILIWIYTPKYRNTDKFTMSCDYDFTKESFVLKTNHYTSEQYNALLTESQEKLHYAMMVFLFIFGTAICSWMYFYLPH